MPLAPLQPHFNEPGVLVGGSKTPKRQQHISFTKKTDRIARSMSPLLPEIPVTVNKEGIFEIERAPQVTAATQTEPMKTVEKVPTLLVGDLFIYLLITGQFGV